jgi:hypothetical protein
MSKKMEITFNGDKYTLEFTKATVRQMERMGFDIDAASKTPLTSTETLFTGAFLANEGRAIKNGIPEKIINKGLPEGMLSALIEMYREPLAALFDTENEGNLEWETNF